MVQKLVIGHSGVESSKRDESEVAARVRLGDPEVLGQLYLELRQPAYAAAQRIVASRSIAEDIAQETFLVLPRALVGFRGGCSLRTLVITIATNLARRQLRARARRQQTLNHLALQLPTSAPVSPEQATAARQLGAAILKALGSLSPDKQRTFVLREYQEHTALETAQITKVAEATVRTRVHHVKQMLRKVLVGLGHAMET